MNKNLSKLFAFTAILAVGFTSCKKKEEVVPEETIDKTTLISKEHILANQKGTAVRFWSSTEDVSYSIADLGIGGASVAKHSKIDLGFVTRATGGNKIIAPNSQDATDIYTDATKQWSDANTSLANWSTRNATKFKIASKAKASDMNLTDVTSTVNYDIIDLEVQAGDATLDAVSVTDGSVVLFKTAAGKYGIIIVKTATGSVVSGSATEGLLTFKAYYKK